jgi:hypothetical protein
MSKVVKLVPPQTVDEEVRDSVVRLLSEALAEAKEGHVRTVVLILGYPNGDWANKASFTDRYSEAIGRLEITKQEWIKQYLDNE